MEINDMRIPFTKYAEIYSTNKNLNDCSIEN